MQVEGHALLEEPMKHALPRLNSACCIALFATLSIALMIVGLALACVCE
jgi:hypothetical protein